MPYRWPGDPSILLPPTQKKGSSEIKFRVKTKEDVYMFRVEVYPNGSVTINVTPVNKQAITFYGDVALDLK